MSNLGPGAACWGLFSITAPGRHRSPSAPTCARLGALCAGGWVLLHTASTSLQQLSPALRRGAFFVAIVRPALTVATAGITHWRCAILLRRTSPFGFASPHRRVISMTMTAQEYRANARQCLSWAESTSDPDNREGFWLLMMRDRSDDDVMPIGQNLLAEMLGVQRPSITHAIAGLEGAGLVERGRQQITILNRQGLIEASCECYQLVRERVAFHLPRTYP